MLSSVWDKALDNLPLAIHHQQALHRATAVGLAMALAPLKPILARAVAAVSVALVAPLLQPLAEMAVQHQLLLLLAIASPTQVVAAAVAAARVALAVATLATAAVLLATVLALQETAVVAVVAAAEAQQPPRLAPAITVAVVVPVW
jgi:hypothetical protein